MVDQRRTNWDFETVKMVKFGTSPIISHSESCLIQSLFSPYITPRNSNLDESLTATQIYHH